MSDYDLDDDIENAIKHGDTDSIQELLESDVEFDRFEALYFAFKYEQWDIVEILLDSNLFNEDDFIDSIEIPNLETAIFFYECGFNTPLVKFMFDNQSYDLIKDILEHHKDIDLNIPISNKHQDTILHCMLKSFYNDEKTLYLLLDNGADANARNSKGKTPFLYACEHLAPNIIQILIDYGASFHIKTDSKQNCLSLLLSNYIRNYSIYSGFEPMMNYFIEEKAMNVYDINIISYLFNDSMHQDMINLIFNQFSNINQTIMNFPILAYIFSQISDISDKRRLYLTELSIKKQVDPNYICDLNNSQSDVIKIIDKNKSAIECHLIPCFFLALELKACIKIFQMLFEYNININLSTETGFTALHLACKMNNEKLVSLLLNHKANVNASTNCHKTPLHYTTSSNIAKLLLENGADLTYRDNKGNFPFFNFSPEILRNYFDSHNISVNLSNIHGKTLIIYAIKHKWIDQIKFLIDKGANLNKIDQKIGSPLHYALKYKLPNDIINMLIDNGANISIPNIKGELPIHYAIKYALDSLPIFIEKLKIKNIKTDLFIPNGQTLLHLASNNQNKDFIKSIFNKKGDIDINAKDYEGKTALHIACQYSPIHIQFLLENNANPNIMDVYGNIPLFYLNKETNKDKSFESNLLLLLQKTKNINQQNTKGQTFLFKKDFIEYFNNEEHFKLLSDKNVDINICDYENCTPLTYSIILGCFSLVFLLNGADPNIVCSHKDWNMHSPFSIYLSK